MSNVHINPNTPPIAILKAGVLSFDGASGAVNFIGWEFDCMGARFPDDHAAARACARAACDHIADHFGQMLPAEMDLTNSRFIVGPKP